MERLLNEALKRCQQAEVYVIEEESTPIHFHNDKVLRIEGKKTTGISLRVIDNEKRLGFATATTMDRKDLIERALFSAQYGDKTEIEFPATKGHDVQCFDPILSQMTIEEIIKQGLEIAEVLKQLDPTMDFELSLGKSIQRVTILNSSGLNVSYDRTNFSIGISSRAEDGFREYSDWDTYSKHFTFDHSRLEEFVRFHQLSKNKVKVKTGKMDIIFNPGAMWPLLYRVAAGANGLMVTRKISPMAGRLGQEIFSPLITITDDPSYPWGFATAPYDDEGSVARKKFIVEKGVLKNYLFDLATATQWGEDAIPGNGIKKSLFDRGIDLQPAIFVSNCMLLPGKNTFDEMVKEVKRGIVVSQIMGGHTGNILAGEFGLNIGSGFLVEDGQIKGKVMDAMVSGNIYQLFKDVKMVGRDLRATRAVFYGFGYSPSILVSNLTVAGSEA